MSVAPSLSERIFRAFTTTKDSIKPISRSTAELVTPDVAIRAIEKVTKQAFDEFVSIVRNIQSVEEVRGQTAGTYLHLVTYVSDSTEKERYGIYAAEKSIFAQYPHLRFEFDLVDRRGYPVEVAEIKDKYAQAIRKLPNNPNALV